MSARVLGVAACLRRVALPAAAARTSRIIRPAGFIAGRRYASVGAATPEAEPAAVKTKTGRKPSTRALAKQLEFITDPWVLGKYIEDLLAKDKFDDALTTVELASKDLDTVVSWNHLIDYSLKQQQIKRAMTTYNNMKKRAQFPNAQTYTIMFRGLAKSNHPKNAVAEAVKLFNQLKNDRRLQPNTIHLNAVLSVCARAHDIDQLFLVAGELEELGLAPTAATYGVILTGMRQYVWREYNDLDKDTKKANVDKMIARGQQIWAEVLDKWRRGKLRLDEPLVCTMGRLQLLATDRKEKLRVLDLIEQTMNIPNLVAAKGAAKPSPATSSPEPSSERRMSRDYRRLDAFVQPGQNTLALILTALLTGRQAGAAPAYWNLLVHDGGLVPDDDNWLRMIGVLKSSRSSAQAAQVLDTLPASGIAVAARSFGIAMEACVRDNVNPHVMTHATRILRTMRARLAPASPDMHTMRLYLRVALVSHAAFRGRAGTGDEVGAKAAYGRQIATALAELWHPYIGLYNKYFKSGAAAATSPTTTDAGTLYNNQKEVIALGRMMVGAFSKVVEEKMLPGNDNRDMIIASAKINKGVTAFFAGRELREPKLNPKATAARKREAAATYGGESSSSSSSSSSRSVFDIDMPALDDKVDEAGMRSLKLRQGGDFVWNTRKMGTRAQEKRTGTGSRDDADKPLIDRWVSPSIGKLRPAEREDAPTEVFIPIKSAAGDVTTDAGGKPTDKAKVATTGGTDQSDQSLWATLMAQKN
ncbi:pentatricopeptide repeat protein [Cordyceps fumosorosea ARSEF 2679]|uniref:Pentatricopeptide repeat protein n=1 Tax=Cordyceps fumosorosea (strain ARSEF 2679) TaxID=1081104 RepID=A0A167RPV0_CORFA|nr:pentatricopeptide repeat protein [Cordyceps fumosorosea ARSEF 2679]OAA58811.1 pentatricopeptide repeat protein [Cordyceps fumosorosea ARSEF 2679]